MSLVARRASPSVRCSEVRRRLEALVDSELDEATTQALRAHIATCPSCRSQHREATSVPARLRALRCPEPPSSLVDEVMRRVAPRNRALDVWGLLVPEVLESLREHGVNPERVPVVVGGVIPDDDAAKLRELGVAEVFTPRDHDLTASIGAIADLVAERSNQAR